MACSACSSFFFLCALVVCMVDVFALAADAFSDDLWVVSNSKSKHYLLPLPCIIMVLSFSAINFYHYYYYLIIFCIPIVLHVYNFVIFVLILFLLHIFFFAAHQSNPIQSNPNQTKPWWMTVSNLELDMNERLRDHWLLFSDNPSCHDQVKEAWADRNYENDLR